MAATMGPGHPRPASPTCPTAIQPACRGGLQTHFRYAPARSCPGHCEAVGPNPKAREPGRGKPAGGAKAGLDSNSCGGKPYKSKPYKQAQHSRRLVELDVTVIPRRCIAGPQLKLYSCTTLHNYSRFRVLGTYAKQDTYFSVDFPSEIVACIGGIALKRSGHDFSFTNRSSGSCCDFAPPWSQRTGSTTISSVPICPVITENGNTVTVKIQAFLRYTPSRFSHRFGGSFFSTNSGPHHMRPGSLQRNILPFLPLKIACDKACTRNRLYLCFFGRSMRFSPTCAKIIDR